MTLASATQMPPTTRSRRTWSSAPRRAWASKPPPTNEFGDQVALNTTNGTNLVSMTVDFQSYGCSDSGHWNTADCQTTDFGGDLHRPRVGPSGEITVKHLRPGNPITLLATSTNTIRNPVPAVGSARLTCPARRDALKRFRPCLREVRLLASPYRSRSPSMDGADFPSKVVWTVQFNTTHAGYAPIIQLKLRATPTRGAATTRSTSE